MIESIMNTLKRQEKHIILTLAILFHLIVLISAIQTWFIQWPGRIWLTIAAVLVIGLSVFLGRQWNRIPLWIGSSAVALLLLVTAYLYGADGAGLRIIGLPFDTVIAVFFLTALGLASWQLSSLPRLPVWVRAIPAAFAIYAAVLVVIGLFKGNSFGEVLGGLWDLPYWIQGAYIGAAVLIPLALIATILISLIPALRPHPFRKGMAITVAFMHLMTILVTGFEMNYQGMVNLASIVPMPGEEPIRVAMERDDDRDVKSVKDSEEAIESCCDEEIVPSAGERITSLSPEEREQAVQKLERFFEALEEAAAEIPRDTFDPDAIVEKVGQDPQKLFTWVRDNTYLVPYRGILRDHIGVLMDRLGNSLDRALLLNELLSRAGHEVRLARGELSKKQAEEVLDEARPVPLEGPLPTEETSPEDIKKLMAKYPDEYQLDQDELQEVIDKMIREQEKMQKKITKRVEEQTKAILKAVGKPKIDIRIKERAKAIEALQDHWWVQWQKESGWVDLDPTLPDAKPEKTVVKVGETYDPDDLDKDLMHLVTIRIIIERWEDGELEENKVLEYTLQPSKLFGERIVLRYVPLNWPEDLNLSEEEKPIERLKTLILKEKEWLPVLTVGSEQIVQKSFTDAGEIKDKPSSPLSSGGLLGGITSSLSGGASEEDAQKDSYLTGACIEYEIHVPGEPEQRIRRQVFDLVGPAARQENNLISPEIAEERRLGRALALLGSTEILILVSHLSPHFYTNLMVNKLLDGREILQDLLHQISSTTSKDLVKQASKLTPLPGPEYSLALARMQWKHQRGDVYLDRSNILCFVRGVQQRQSLKGELKEFQGFDIVVNEVAVRPQSQTEPFQIRLEQGVLDTNAEALLVYNSGQLIENVAESFARVYATGIKWWAIRNAEDPLWIRAELPKDVRIHIEKDLKKDYAVIVPERALNVEGHTFMGWWRVNLRNGTTLGVIEPGKGSALTQYIIKIGLIATSCVLVGLSGPSLPHEAYIVNCVIGASLGAAFFAMGSKMFLYALMAIIIANFKIP
jgi:hypothetical protein